MPQAQLLERIRSSAKPLFTASVNPRAWTVLRRVLQRRGAAWMAVFVEGTSQHLPFVVVLAEGPPTWEGSLAVSSAEAARLARCYLRPRQPDEYEVQGAWRIAGGQSSLEVAG